MVIAYTPKGERHADMFVGRAWKKDGKLEVKTRAGNVTEELPTDEAIATITERVMEGRKGLPAPAEA